MTVAEGSDNKRVSLRRCPFIPDPTSVTTWQRARPRPVAPAATRPVCRSRSSRWSAGQTRQYATTRPSPGSGTVTSHRPDGVRTTGTGIFPSRAVW
jgi:hypothetical protein